MNGTRIRLITEAESGTMAAVRGLEELLPSPRWRAEHTNAAAQLMLERARSAALVNELAALRSEHGMHLSSILPVSVHEQSPLRVEDVISARNAAAASAASAEVDRNAATVARDAVVSLAAELHAARLDAQLSEERGAAAVAALCDELVDVRANLDAAMHRIPEVEAAAYGSAMRRTSEQHEQDESRIAAAEADAEISAASAEVARTDASLRCDEASAVARSASAKAESAIHERDRAEARAVHAEAVAADARDINAALRADIDALQAALSATQADAAAARAALAAASAAARAAMGKPSLELPSHEATARFQSDTAGGNIATDEVSTRRATIRLLEAEREAIADVLAGIAPLPAFVRGLSYKCGAQGDAAAVADGADVGSAGNDEQAAFTASATVTAVQSSSSQMMTRLRALAQERPLIIDALGQMDGALRGFRLERERLFATLLSAHDGEASYEASISTLRRQLTAMRAELSAATEARDRMADLLSQAETELRAKSEAFVELSDAHERVTQRLSLVEAELRAKEDALAASREDASALLSRLNSMRAEAERAASVASSLRRSDAALAAAATADAEAARTNETVLLTTQLNAAKHACDVAEASVEELTSRVAAITAEADSARADVTRLTASAHQLQLSLAAAEAAHTEALCLSRESEAQRKRLHLALDEASEERDSALHRVAQHAAENAALRARLGDADARELRRRDDDRVLALTRARIIETEGALADARAALSAATSRAAESRAVAEAELDAAHAATARVADELQRIARVREIEAAEAAAASSAAARSAASVHRELEAQTSEAGALRERCHALQSQLASAASEAATARDAARQWHEESLRARAESAAEAERAASAHRALQAQLEAIKADFSAFLALFHGGTSQPHSPMRRFDDAPVQQHVTPPSRSFEGASFGTTSHSTPSGGATDGLSIELMSAINTEMQDLKHRLEALHRDELPAASAARKTESRRLAIPRTEPAGLTATATAPRPARPASARKTRAAVTGRSTTTSPAPLVATQRASYDRPPSVATPSQEDSTEDASSTGDGNAAFATHYRRRALHSPIRGGDATDRL